jgi:hypothetical protein
LLLLDAVGDFIVEAFARAEECDFGVGVEEVENAACCYLGIALGSMSTLSFCKVDLSAGLETYLAAADDQDFLVLDLPGEDQRAAAFDFWVLVVVVFHGCGVVCLSVVLWRAGSCCMLVELLMEILNPVDCAYHRPPPLSHCCGERPSAGHALAGIRM